MYIFSRRAGDNVRPEYVESALTLGAGPWSIFRWVYVPATVPEIIAGFRIALAGAWGLEAIAELLGAQRGAGLLIKFYANAFVVDGMLALVLLLGLISVVLDRLTIVAGRYLTRWSESGHTLQL
jgi:ABC-type nitrate/sulfonate/bicarbonate transport system permease component